MTLDLMLSLMLCVTLYTKLQNFSKISPATESLPSVRSPGKLGMVGGGGLTLLPSVIWVLGIGRKSENYAGRGALKGEFDFAGLWPAGAGIAYFPEEFGNPRYSAWEARTLPLSYARSLRSILRGASTASQGTTSLLQD